MAQKVLSRRPLLSMNWQREDRDMPLQTRMQPSVAESMLFEKRYRAVKKYLPMRSRPGLLWYGPCT